MILANLIDRICLCAYDSVKLEEATILFEELEKTLEHEKPTQTQIARIEAAVNELLQRIDVVEQYSKIYAGLTVSHKLLSRLCINIDLYHERFSLMSPHEVLQWKYGDSWWKEYEERKLNEASS